MSANTQEMVSSLRPEASGRVAPGWWGMVLLILTEATLFATMLASYFYLRATSATWPQGSIPPEDLVLPGIMTVILLVSSAPMIWADHQIRRGKVRNMRIGITLTFILGATFLGLQVNELTHKAYGPEVNAYTSAFYAITSLHGLHVVVGLAMLLFTGIRAFLGHFNERRNLAVTNTGLYWHFVDVVWLFVFISVYVSPHVLK